LCKHRSDLTVDIIYTPIKICEVYGAYLRVCEVLSVSFGLVLIPCVNALACQRVGNLEFVGCYWRIPGTITSLALCVKTCVMWNVSDVAGVFLALSLSLALPVHLFVVSLVCLLIVCTVTG